jgi:hypothetical protein
VAVGSGKSKLLNKMYAYRSRSNYKFYSRLVPNYRLIIEQIRRFITIRLTF